MLRGRAVALAAGAVLAGQLFAGAAAAATAVPTRVAPPGDCRLPAPAGVNNEHAGPTDYTRWLRPVGTVRAVVLFVDFPDVAAGAAAELTERRTMFQTQPADWFSRSSYGRVSLSLTFTTTWHRMPRSQTAYVGYNTSFDGQRAYLQDAVNAADAAVDFRQFEIVYVVPPRSATVFTNSPAFIASPGWGVFADGVQRRHGATFGLDMDYWGYKVLNHETGHVFGLPDLYRYAPSPPWHEPVGGWDLMGLISGPAPDHFAWHKWKMGWLDDQQIHCVTSRGRTSATLAPLGSAGGRKAVVVRVAPQRAIVVENRQVGALDVASPCFRPGVLAYAVDATVGGGDEPIRVLDRLPANAVAGCGADHAELDNATLVTVDHVVSDAVSGVRVRLTGISGSSRTVQVTW